MAVEFTFLIVTLLNSRKRLWNTLNGFPCLTVKILCISSDRNDWFCGTTSDFEQNFTQGKQFWRT